VGRWACTERERPGRVIGVTSHAFVKPFDE
jgi:hypothetical protein